MTDYNAILETETNPGQPSKSSLWKRWSKNWIAGFEGAADAPRLQPAALDRLIAGAVTKYKAIDCGPFSAVTKAVAMRFAFLQYGTIRVYFEHSGTSSTARLTRERGGVFTDLGTWSGGSGWSARTIDVPVQFGDVLELTVIGNPTYPPSFRNIVLANSGGLLWPSMAGGAYI